MGSVGQAELVGQNQDVSVERCEECGFDSDDWSDASAIAAIQRLPERWTTAVAGLTSSDQLWRPVPQMWSIAEYADHVREVLFGMRFLLDTAISQPGTDLGEAPPRVAGLDYHRRPCRPRPSHRGAIVHIYKGRAQARRGTMATAPTTTPGVSDHPDDEWPPF